ncbi:hypothetical protein LTR53_011426 [Teratosphaeriaceae sp. CCFEE 6253]|nr:hypothetical protein LTR53_011426 [Teratosphaeriaceae sp. CCFEE 6253]
MGLTKIILAVCLALFATVAAIPVNGTCSCIPGSLATLKLGSHPQRRRASARHTRCRQHHHGDGEHTLHFQTSVSPRGLADFTRKTWEKGKWFRERFTFGALTCDDIAGHFNKEFATLPNKKHRNLKCGLFTFDVSTYNNLYNGKFALACAL